MCPLLSGEGIFFLAAVIKKSNVPDRMAGYLQDGFSGNFHAYAHAGNDHSASYLNHAS